MATWYVRTEEAELGPLKPSQLLTMIREGELVGGTPIRKDDSAWFPAREVGGLFDAARRPTIEHYCPACDARCPEPPCQCPTCMQYLERTRKNIIHHDVQAGIEEVTEVVKKGHSAKRWFQRRKK